MRLVLGLLSLCVLVGCPSTGSGGSAGGSGTGGSGTGGSGTGGSGTGGGTGTGGGGVNGPIPFDQLCQRMSDNYRALLLSSTSTCAPGPTVQTDYLHQGVFTGSPGDAPSTSTNAQLLDAFLGCVPDGGTFLVGALAQLQESIAAGRISYDPNKAAECALTSSRDAGYAVACREVFVPLVGAAGACLRSEDCLPGLYCLPAAAASCGGQCVAKLTAGASCTPTRDTCLDGQCDRVTDAGYVCEADAATDGGVGERCYTTGSQDLCRSNLRCVTDAQMPALPDGGVNAFCTAPVGDGMTCGVFGSVDLAPGCASQCSSCYSSDAGFATLGVCRPRGGAAAPCTVDADCVPFHYCIANACVAQPRPGEACSVVRNGSRGTCRWVDNFCRGTTADAGTGSCSALPGLNDPCGRGRADRSYTCATGTCDSVSGTCRPTPTVGEVCDGTCAGEARCVIGADGGSICAAPPPAGQPCLSSYLCDDSAYCLTGQCVAKAAAGAACGSDSECLNGNCLPVQRVCAADCSPGGAGVTGCPNGLRDLSLLLAGFGLVLLPRRRRPPR